MDYGEATSMQHTDRPGSIKVGTLWEMTGCSASITLIGAGGKTTTLLALVREIESRSWKTVATTTTKVYPLPMETLWCEENIPPTPELQYPCFWYAGEVNPELETTEKTRPIKQNEENDPLMTQDRKKKKWRGPTLAQVDQALLRETERIWVIEGDGAKERKLKCWAEHEPQIPLGTQCAVLMIHGGLWAKILKEHDIHRPERCPGLTGQTWNGKTIIEYLLNSPVFEPRFRSLNWVVLFNEFENLDEPVENRSAERFSLRHFSFEGLEMLSGMLDGKEQPANLRIAVGDVRKGRMQWCDLW